MPTHVRLQHARRFSYTMLADKSMFSWHNLQVLESL
jgi:hypothetical protein